MEKCHSMVTRQLPTLLPIPYRSRPRKHRLTRTARAYGASWYIHVMFREPTYVQQVDSAFAYWHIPYYILRIAYCYAAVECDVLRIGIFRITFCVLHITYCVL